MELVKKERSVQAAVCSECPDPSFGALVSACTRCRHIEDLIHQVAELQEPVNRLLSIRGAELEIDTWLQIHVPVVASTESEAPWTLMTRRSRTPVQPPPSSRTTTNKYEALTILTTIDTQKQDLREKSMPAAHGRYRKKKRRVLTVGDSLLRGTEAPICRPDREAHEVCCPPGAKVQDGAKRVPQLVKSTDCYSLLLFHRHKSNCKSEPCQS